MNRTITYEEGQFMLADWFKELERLGWHWEDCPDCGERSLVSPDSKVKACAECNENWLMAIGEKLKEQLQKEVPDDFYCPCGCDGEAEHCAYAGTCCVCGKKYYGGHGYGDKEHACDDCRNGSKAIDELAIVKQEVEKLKRAVELTAQERDKLGAAIGVLSGKLSSMVMEIERLRAGIQQIADAPGNYLNAYGKKMRKDARQLLLAKVE